MTKTQRGGTLMKMAKNDQISKRGVFDENGQNDQKSKGGSLMKMTKNDQKSKRGVFDENDQKSKRGVFGVGP